MGAENDTLYQSPQKLPNQKPECSFSSPGSSSYLFHLYFSVNEKTGLLGQRVVTSQIREEFPASPTRDLYRALSPGYSPTGDLEWQDEFDFEMESGDQGFKQMLLPKLQMLQKQLINEFYDGDNIDMKKKKLLESKVSKSIAKICSGSLSPSTV